MRSLFSGESWPSHDHVGYEVTVEGLAAGDWVVAAGGHLLREGQAVKPVDRDNRPVKLK